MIYSFLHKRLFFLFLLPLFLSANVHPIYISVTEIEHNQKERALEVSCKIFIDDFEQTLRGLYKTKIDLLDPAQHQSMDKYVADYVKKHLQISADGKPVALKYIGYERIDEGIYSYFEAVDIAAPKKIHVSNRILYEYKKEQMSLMHVTVAGERKSTKLVNPESSAQIDF